MLFSLPKFNLNHRTWIDNVAALENQAKEDVALVFRKVYRSHQN